MSLSMLPMNFSKKVSNQNLNQIHKKSLIKKRQTQKQQQKRQNKVLKK